MLAVDTNVVARYLTDDDARQAARVRRLIDGENVFIPVTVLLETEWVLRHVYKFAVAEVARALRTLAGQPTVALERPDAVAIALDWAEQGMDFANALHLAFSRHCTAFASFDLALAKSADRIGALKVRTP